MVYLDTLFLNVLWVLSAKFLTHRDKMITRATDFSGSRFTLSQLISEISFKFRWITACIFICSTHSICLPVCLCYLFHVGYLRVTIERIDRDRPIPHIVDESETVLNETMSNENQQEKGSFSKDRHPTVKMLTFHRWTSL